MESKYYKKVRQLNSIVPEELTCSIYPKERETMGGYIRALDAQLNNHFKGAPIGEPCMSDAQNLAKIALHITLERSVMGKVAEFLSIICDVVSLWNLEVGKDNDLEDILLATNQLINGTLTLATILNIFREWLPQMRRLTEKPIAFDIAPHYLKQLEGKDD